jgi:hypothetical protein
MKTNWTKTEPVYEPNNKCVYLHVDRYPIRPGVCLDTVFHVAITTDDPVKTLREAKILVSQILNDHSIEEIVERSLPIGFSIMCENTWQILLWHVEHRKLVRFDRIPGSAELQVGFGDIGIIDSGIN